MSKHHVYTMEGRLESFFFFLCSTVTEQDQTHIINGQQAAHTEERTFCVSSVKEMNTVEETEGGLSPHAAYDDITAEICVSLNHAKRLFCALRYRANIT